MRTPPLTALETEQSLARLEALARLMDGAFLIPGTNIRLGLDAIAGLLPGVGDVMSGVVSSYLIWEARQLGVSKLVLARMAANVAIDTAIGSIPIVGDVFDVAFRANLKNMKILREHLERRGLITNRGKIIEGEAVRIS